MRYQKRHNSREAVFYAAFLITTALLINCGFANAAPKTKGKEPQTAAKKPVLKGKSPQAIKPSPAVTPAQVPPVAEKTKGSVALGNADFNMSKAPTNISADSLTLYNEKRTFTYTGNVVVTQADLTLHSDFLDGNYSDKNEIEKIVARSNVEITKGAEMKATGQRAEYNALNRTIVLTETPSIEQNGNTLTADLIRIYIDENRSIAEGNVKVTMKSADDGLGRAPTPTPAGTVTAAASAPPSVVSQ